jgi:hypothetical protein
MRTKKYKLILYYGAKPEQTQAQTPPAWELYDLEQDPNEMNNIYAQAKPQIISQLKKQFAQMRSDNRADDPKFLANQVIEEFWDYSPSDHKKAIEISKKYADYRSAKENN